RAAWQARIDERAYEIWVAGGRRDGHAVEDWLQAKRELLVDVSALERAPHADLHEPADERAMNMALWPVTWGQFLSQMLAPGTCEAARRDARNARIAMRALDLYRARTERGLDDWLEAERQVLAWEIWDQRGRPSGAALDHWLLGERAQAGTPEGRAARDAILAHLAHERWRARAQSGAPGDAVSDWYAAERALRDRIAACARQEYWRRLDEPRAVEDWLRAEELELPGLIRERAYELSLHRGDAAPDPIGDWLAAELYERFSDASVRAARDYFVRWVRAGGPLPAMRIANQPYGLLPVMALDWFEAIEPDSPPGGFIRILKTLRDVGFGPLVSGVPRLGASVMQTAEAAQAALLEIFRTAPHSQELYGRSMLGPEYHAMLSRFAPAEPGAIPWSRPHAFQRFGLFSWLGLGWDPRVAETALAGTVMPAMGVQLGKGFPMKLPLVRAVGGAAPADYLPALAGSVARFDELWNLGPLQGETPLLYWLLRHAALLGWGAVAARLLAARGLLGERELVEPELIGVFPGDPQESALKRLVARTIVDPSYYTGPLVMSVVTPIPLTSYIPAKLGKGDESLRELEEFRQSLGVLATLSEERLETLLCGSLDLATHRLDAWITSFATRRLEHLRAKRRDGVHLGGYGWAVDVRPRQAEAGRVNAGYVQAPSLPQAVTAAILRGGHHAHRDSSPNPFDIDLSSRRVRLATWFLDGVRQKQPLGALLGYRFERRLQTGGGASLIDDLRERFPIRATSVSTDGSTAEAIAAHDVVDGLALRTARVTTDIIKSAWGTEWQSALAVPGVESALGGALAALEDDVDAVADALLAEGVHQIVQGNAARAGAVLDAVARGDAPSPTLEFCRTPRSGITVTHRVIAVIRDAGLLGAALTIRSRLEPRLNAWVAGLIPPLGQVRYRVEGTTETLGALGLAPLDYLYMVDAREPIPDANLRALLLRAGGAAQSADLDLGRDPGWDPSVFSVRDFLTIVQAVRALVLGARPLAATDLAVPGTATEAADEDLGVRVRAAQEELDATITSLARDDAGAEELCRAALLGIAAAVPSPSEDGATTANRVAMVLDLLRRRALALADLQRRVPPAPAREQLHAVLGPDFEVLAAVRAPRATELCGAAAASRDLQAGDPTAATLWLQRAARVRPAVARLNRALLSAEAAQAAAGLAFTVAQLPFAPGDRWLALPFAPGAPPERGGGKLSLVIHPAAPLDLGGPVAGLVIDEWTEVIPSASQITGLTFHFDSPGAQAPQSILLAVPANRSPRWTSELLEQTLRETLALARLRAVDLHVYRSSKVHDLLPAIQLAFNPTGDALSTNPAVLAGAT
ncbi:MAG TPA: DUF2934 domain-containing protein, partial [Myxococcota bacterium]|nr:DUF2934 domain-containing protein [Myxococcota bacterium]